MPWKNSGNYNYSEQHYPVNSHCMIAETQLPSLRKERKFILITWVCFIVVAGLSLLHHELWRDEWQAWLIVKNSPDLSSLFQKIRYEGHPSLWFLLLWLVQQCSDNVVSMQLLHLAIAASAAFVWLRYAPLSKLLRGLFVFGYFPLFEFAVISRNYGLGMLLLFLFLVSFTYHRNNLVAQSILLALMMQTNLFAFLIAATMGFGVALQLKFERQETKIHLKKCLPAVLILLAGFVCCYLTIRPPADHHFGYWREGIHWKYVKPILPLFSEAMIPIPKPEFHFWNTNLFIELKIRFALYFILMLGLFILFRKNIKILMTFFIGVILIATLLYLKNLQFIRHTGSFYLLFIACLWMLHTVPGTKKDLIKFKSFSKERFSHAIVTSIFIAHLIASAIAISIDFEKPFTAAEAAMTYVKKNDLNALPLTAESDFIAISLTGYLNRPAYQLRTKKIADYVTWNYGRINQTTEQELIERAKAFSLQEQKDVLLISSYQFLNQYPNVIFLESFTESIQSDEIYFLYRIQLK